MVIGFKLGCRVKQYWQRCCCLMVIIALLWGVGIGNTSTAFAGINDDQYDGNIFMLYASNAGLIPAKVNLAAAIQKQRPTLVMFYVDDSRECKENALVLTQLQGEYKQSLNLLPIMADAINPERQYQPNDAQYYYNGEYVPQFVLLDGTGQVVLNQIGQLPFEALDTPVRELLELPPRTEALRLERPAFSPSPSADRTFVGDAIRSLESGRGEPVQ
ncbi:MAG: hypothetical protein HC934_12270 [Acaryochloridaceae cyanobacterium SU_2_1]|nr:hypothetical protein [Acaryochloridaceae cyanobacterium SU_2_1]NJM95076.1 hypothetical protein [Acaryochloridaceae cyanobacterium CSU_5_19]